MSELVEEKRKPGRPVEWLARLAPCFERPDEWVHVASYTNKGSVASARKRISEYDWFDSRQEKQDDGTFKVYARYDGAA